MMDKDEQTSMGDHRGRARCGRPLFRALTIVALATGPLLSGCQPTSSSRPPDVPNQTAVRTAQPVAAPEGSIHIAPIRQADKPSQDGTPPDQSPAAASVASVAMAKDGSGNGAEHPPASGNPEVAAGYGLAATSARAASSEASPSPFGSLLGFHYSGKVSRPPGSGTPPDGAQRVSLVGLTLRDAVGLAIANHPDVSRGVAVVSQSAAEVMVAKGAWFPVLNYSVAPGYGSAYSRGSASGTQSSGGVSQLVYDFGKTPGRIEQADAALSRQRHALNSTIEGVAYAAASHYVEFAAAQATLDAAREAIANLGKLRGMIAERVQASLSSASDLTQAEVALQRAVVDQVQAQTRLNVAADNLAEIIGMRPKSVADLAAVNEAVAALAKGSGDIENAPVVLAAKAAIKEAEAQVKIVQSDYYPAISVVANKSMMSGGDNAYDSEWAGVALSGAISAVGQNSRRVEAAQANKDAAERQLESQRLTMRTTLTSAETEMAGADSRRQAFDAMKGLSRTSRDLYWQEYTLGKRPLTQVLDAERDIFSAEAARIAAIADGVAARLKGQAAVGLLVHRLRASDR